MLKTRVIPALLLKNGGLIKTEKFGKFTYIGDPCNAVRIFNELEVDELIFLDISASREKHEPDFDLLADLASECFMPMTYGGGVSTFEQAQRIFAIGFEKISLNNICVEDPQLVTLLSAHFGAQSIVGSIDVKKNLWGKYEVRVLNGTKSVRKDPIKYAKELEILGVGEILITDIDREGTWEGFNLTLIKNVSEAVNIPVIAQGGAGTIGHIGKAKDAGASAVALGSMVVFQKKGMGVLVNFPDKNQLELVL
jgi:imidazole glycerol-phosphate synthase subunit HisF